MFQEYQKNKESCIVDKMQKEIINPIEKDMKETSDSCPKCGNSLVNKEENNQLVKYCITESFDVKSGTVTACGYSSRG